MLQEEAPAAKLTASVILAIVFCVLTGLLALWLGLFGLSGKGSAADIATALPNLFTGATSLLAAVGYGLLRRWVVPVYALCVAAHWYSHAALLALHGGLSHFSPRTISLFVLPTLAACVLVSMAQQAKRGRLH